VNPGADRSEPETRQHSATTLEILMFITALGGISLALLMAVGFGAVGLVAAVGGSQLDALTGFWTMAGSLTIAAALVPPAYWSGRAVFGLPPAGISRPNALWLVPILAYPLCLGLGWLAHTRDSATLILGPVALIGTACLSAILVGWLLRRLGPPVTPLRAWGHFTVGLTGMPLAAVLVEFVVLLPLLAILGFWLVMSPEGQAWAATFRDTTDPELALQAAGELLASPFVLIGVYGYVGLAIPVIEELIKTMAVWPFLRRGLSSAEAFLGGALGGVGYALFEALFLTQPGEAWIATTFARIGATLLHVFTAALTSYGLMRGVRTRRYAITVGAVLGAIAMHALWNLSAVTIGISSTPIGASPEPPGAGVNGLAVIVLLALTLTSALGLVLAWGRLPAAEPDRI
jgi:hypothetical protein